MDGPSDSQMAEARRAVAREMAALTAQHASVAAKVERLQAESTQAVSMLQTALGDAGAKLLASASHDSVVKVWDVGHLYGGEGGEGGDDAEDEGDSSDDEGRRRGKKRKKGGKASLASSGRRHHNRQRETAAFFSDIAD